MMGLATEFWNIVGERAKPTDLKVGDTIWLEFGKLRTLQIVTDAWDEPQKGRQIRFRAPELGEICGQPVMTVIAE